MPKLTNTQTSPTVIITHQELERYTSALSDVLCWLNGFKAGGGTYSPDTTNELQNLNIKVNTINPVMDDQIQIEEGNTEADITDLVAAADATTDLRVVVIGTDVAMGIDGAPCWEEVHRSNMTKFIDGHRRADGKWIKWPSYSPANLAPIIEAQSKHLSIIMAQEKAFEVEIGKGEIE